MWGERVNAQFRVKIFNIFNRVNLAPPVNNLASSSLGGSPSTMAPSTAHPVSSPVSSVIPYCPFPAMKDQTPELASQPRRRRTAVSLFVVAEAEEAEQVAKGWTVHRHIGIVRCCDRVGEVIPAAARDRLKSPIPLDKFHNRNVIGILVRNVSPLEYFETTISGIRVPSPK